MDVQSVRIEWADIRDTFKVPSISGEGAHSPSATCATWISITSFILFLGQANDLLYGAGDDLLTQLEPASVNASITANGMEAAANGMLDAVNQVRGTKSNALVNRILIWIFNGQRADCLETVSCLKNLRPPNSSQDLFAHIDSLSEIGSARWYQQKLKYAQHQIQVYVRPTIRGSSLGSNSRKV
jgi:hypothetical protein